MENQGYFGPDDINESDVVGTCVIRYGSFGKNFIVCVHRSFDDTDKKDWGARCEAIEADAIEFADSWCEDMPGDVMDYLHNDDVDNYDYFDPESSHPK